MSIDELGATVSPPEGQRPAVPWDEVEAMLGSALPRDYKELVETYGPGSFWGFIHVFQVDGQYPALDLVGQVSVNLDALKYLRDRGEVVPYDIEGDASLLSCGRTDNGDIIYWVRERSIDPDDWVIAVNAARDDRWFEYSGGITSFLSKVMTRALTVPVFPEALSGRRPSFQPY
ncbi:SMI1/KNR4 family protein [Catenulispora subtropica]|uniref:SMI1/KNR4 family protein n=1 Tax=Catenulispora subtropica TaxID=450798 RepID=UPI0031CF2501